MRQSSLGDRRLTIRPRESTVRREQEDPNDAISEGKPTFEYRRENAGLKSVALGTSALLLVIFVLQNLDEANIDFLFWDWDIATALPIGIAAALGFVIGWSVNWLRRRTKRRNVGREKD
jgi:uncharacterized integral membrane protein